MSNEKLAIERAQPFGEECCEDEIRVFGSSYETLYFQRTPFNDLSLDLDRYLFIGRRGTGKTSLAHHFSFQKHIPNARCVDVDEPAVYEKVLASISEHAAKAPEHCLARVVKIWDYLIWSLVFDVLADKDPVIKSACMLTTNEEASSLIREILKALLSRFLGDREGELSDELEEFLVTGPFNEAREKALEICETEPVIIAIDSLEKYSTDNQPMMRATAALVESVSKFNRNYAHRGVHVKLFISAEVFPYLEENEISNPSKYIRRPVFLMWRPKDLMRLASWRLNEFFRRSNSYRKYAVGHINWDDPSEVLKKVWEPRFGRWLQNGLELSEPTFPYVLRHTQLRPRQFVFLCNGIAQAASEAGEFPQCSNKAVVDAVKQLERRLAGELINSYSKVYPNVGDIVRALEGFPTVFRGKDLDRAAPSTASQWPAGEYSPYDFRRLVAELGIVGRVRSWDKRARIIAADFEYAIEDRLTISDRDECVIHPMFFEKLSTKRTHESIIYPFPDHPDFKF